MIKKDMLENENIEVTRQGNGMLTTKDRIIKILKSKKFFLAVLIIIAISGVYGSFHFYSKYKALTVDANAEAKKETDKLIADLGKLMELPTDEVPTVATISDKSKLKDQAFFSTAENGDVLFAYTNAMKAILYRPSINKIINVAAISINQPQDVTQGVKKTATTPVTSKH